MKRGLCCIAIILALAIMLASCGSAPTINENPQGLDFYLQDDGTYAVEIGHAKLLSKVEIPATYNGKAVTKIISSIQANDALVEIVIPDSVTLISRRAFDGCSNLKSIKYRGTESQWQEISKGVDWHPATGEYTITYNFTGK